MDGNGRTARFVMNSQLVTAGYPWVAIPVERRQEYIAALEQASVEGDIEGARVVYWEGDWIMFVSNFSNPGGGQFAPLLE